MKWIILVSVVCIACSHKSRIINSKAKADSIVWRMNNKMRYELYEQPTLEPMKHYLAAMEDTAREINYDRLTFHWTLNKVQLYNLEEKTDSAMALMAKAVKLSKSRKITQKDKLTLSIIYNTMLSNQGMIDSALRVANEAYFLAREYDTTRLAQTSLDLAKIYLKLDDLPNMKKYSLEARNRSYDEPELKTFIASAISYYYDRVGENDSAIYFFENSAKDSFLVNKPRDLADNYTNTAVFLAKKGNIKGALTYQLKSLAIYDSLGEKDIVGCINLAETYGTLKDFKKADAFLDTAIVYARGRSDYNLLRVAWKSKAEQYAKIPDYKKAAVALDSAYERYTIETDSSLRQQARELETKYAVREKDNEINTLALTNQAHLKVRRQQSITIIAISIATLFLAIIGLLLWRRRQTEMFLRENILKQQLLRAQMNPHFLFNSLSILRNFIRDQNHEKAMGYLTSLAKLMRFQFENASETFVSLSSEIEALDAYLNVQMLYHPGLFDYKISAYNDFEQEDIYIPPMLFQPFVENTILHGFAGINYQGHLSVTIEKRHFTLHCLIEDNGKGLQTVQGNRKISSTEINRERLLILEKQTRRSATLNRIEKNTADGHGVRIEMEIPFRLNKRDLVSAKSTKKYFRIIKA